MNIKIRNLWVLVSWGVFVATAFGGVLTGTVRNGTSGFSVPADLKIQLNEYRRAGQEQTQKTLEIFAVPDARGNFVFTDLAEDPNVAYEPMVVYKGIKYYGQAAILTKEQPRAQSNVTIFETTQNDSAITAVREHMLISPAEGFINLKEVVVFNNTGDRTYVGSRLAENGKFRTMTFRLPDDARAVELGEGAMACCIEFEKGGFYDTMEFPPGKRQITYFYQIDAPDKTLKLSKPISFSVAEMDIIPLDPEIQVSGPGIRETSVAGTRARMFVASDLKAGANLELEISGLKGKPLNASFLFLGIFSFVLVVGMVVVLKKSRPKASEKDISSALSAPEPVDRIEERENLIREIALLDELFESGKLEAGEYRTRREVLKSQLMNLKSINV